MKDLKILILQNVLYYSFAYFRQTRVVKSFSEIKIVFPLKDTLKCKYTKYLKCFVFRVHLKCLKLYETYFEIHHKVLNAF